MSTIAEIEERQARGESPDEQAIRRAYEEEVERLKKTPPDAPAVDTTSVLGFSRGSLDRSTSYVAKKLEETREQLREHESNVHAKERELVEAKKASARLRAHRDYWRELLRKDIGS